MLIAPPRVDAAGGASEAAGRTCGRSELSGAPGGKPADGGWRTVQQKGARGPAERSHARKSTELCHLQLGRVRLGGQNS
eukprot:12781570-Alexandrium_andersonii.AAC.1